MKHVHTEGIEIVQRGLANIVVKTKNHDLREILE